MCTSSSPIDFSNISIYDLFQNCDNFSPKKSNHENVPLLDDRLVTYYAWSNNKNYKLAECREAMINRQDPNNLPHFNWKSFEQAMFMKKFRLLGTNNRAYTLALKSNPTVQDLEEQSYLDASFANLSAIAKYLLDHPLLAKEYRGLLPFGREVIKFYNTIVPESSLVKGSPSYKDHIRLQEISNDKAILMGIPTVVVNGLMYQFGRKIGAPDNDLFDED